VWRRIWGARTTETETRAPSPKLTDEELIERTAKEIVQRRLAAPAIFLLESSKPLSFIASQGLIFLGPFIDAAFEVPQYDAFCQMIESRENVEKLTRRIEELDEERLGRRRRNPEQAEVDDEGEQHGARPD
jgi:hypothetical protein